MNLELLSPRPPLHWEPVVIMAVGLFRYLYLKYIAVPPTQATIDDLDEKSFLGGFGYTPGSGIAVIIMGTLLFIPMNFALLAWAFHRLFD
jgi:hypothetical protein